MSRFADWLEKLDPQTDPDPAPLQKFARDNAADWPQRGYEFTQFRQVIDQATPPPANRDELLILLGTYFERWKSQSPLRGTSGNIRVGVMGLIAFGIVVAGVLAYGLFFNPSFLNLLAKVEQVRGLITFLFAFSTTSVIILIAIAIFFLKDKDDVKERYVHAKDLLTVVIGVMGTILGFYFGSATGDRTQVAIADVATSPSIARPGGAISLTGRVVGGAGPYSYTITFSDPAGKIAADAIKPVQGTTETGIFSASATVPAAAEPTTLVFLISARDSKGAQTQSAGVVSVEAKEAEQKQPDTKEPEKTPTPPAASTPAAGAPSGATKGQ